MDRCEKIPAYRLGTVSLNAPAVYPRRHHLCETYVTMRKAQPDGPPVMGWGRYIDRFERRDGVWKIAHRRVTLEGMTGAVGYDPGLFTQARQDRSDLSYER